MSCLGYYMHNLLIDLFKRLSLLRMLLNIILLLSHLVEKAHSKTAVWEETRSIVK